MRFLLAHDDDECRFPGVLLSAEGLGEKAKWIQIAYAGEWKGHHMGAFRLTRADFDRIVENFHAHAAYDKGKSDVVAFDFDHASEMPPTSAAVALAGKPAQGWVRELEVRDGDGKAQLWALTRVLEPAKTYLTQGKIKWVSAAIDFRARDLVTGDPCGPVLTSVAFTNQPFLRALPAIAASVRPVPKETKPMKLTPMLLSSLAIETLTPTDEEIEKAIVTLANKNSTLEKENADLKKTGAEADVDAVLLTYGPKDEATRKLMRPSLVAHRTTDPKGFAEAYPKLPPAANAAALTQRLTPDAPVTGRRALGQNRTLASIGTNGRVFMNAQPQQQPAEVNEDQAVEFAQKLLACPGNNKHERAMSFVKMNGGEKLSFDQLHDQACRLLSANGIPSHILDVTELLEA